MLKISYLYLAGVHTHLTNTTIIHHEGNQPNFTGVSRYPPYINEQGISIFGPPNGSVTNTPSSKG